MTGQDSPQRRQHHVAMDDAISYLVEAVDDLERLLEQIQGAGTPPNTPMETENVGVKPPLPNLMSFLMEGSDRIRGIADRIISTKYGMRESLF